MTLTLQQRADAHFLAIYILLPIQNKMEESQEAPKRSRAEDARERSREHEIVQKTPNSPPGSGEKY